MKEIKVHGIVLREDPMGDKDKRLVLLTREQGKITVLAKGAMGAKSKFRALCGVFSYVELVLTHGATFYYIKEGTLIESFYSLRGDLFKLSYASWILEVGEVFCLEGQENEELLAILLRGLYMESKAEEGMESLPADVTVFRILAENGYYPELARCRGELSSEEMNHDLSVDPILFQPSVGGIYCSECQKRLKTGAGIRLSTGALQALRYMIEQSPGKAYSFKVSEEVGKQIHEAVTDYLAEQTEHGYTSLGFLGKITGSP
ncbi:MAG: DNA repair protein RecO [Firmicutes bacterium]|nr:DNA repair protein RecO [Bacillota bacterium]